MPYGPGSIVLFVLVSYMVGSLPVAWIVGRLRGIDITRTGTGNAGGSNAFITMGPFYGIIVGVLDVLKGFLVGWTALHYFDSLAFFYLGGIAVILGQCYPVFTGFRGGKGAGTAVGTLFAVTPLWSLVLVITWGLLVLVFRRTSTANLVAVWLFLVVSYFFARPFAGYVALLVALIYYTHRDNIERIARRVEVGIDDLLENKR